MKPERYIWDEDSTHRAVAGKEYDEVWDYAEQLENQIVELLEALQAVNKRLWTRRFDFSEADHNAMNAASEAICNTREDNEPSWTSDTSYCESCEAEADYHTDLILCDNCKAKD